MSCMVGTLIVVDATPAHFITDSGSKRCQQRKMAAAEIHLYIQHSWSTGFNKFPLVTVPCVSVKPNVAKYYEAYKNVLELIIVLFIQDGWLYGLATLSLLYMRIQSCKVTSLLGEMDVYSCAHHCLSRVIMFFRLYIKRIQ